MAMRATASRLVLYDYLLYAVLIALFALPIAGWRDLSMIDEVRYPTIVREMIANDTWWKLTINGVPYLEKPPLFFAMLRAYVQTTGRDSAGGYLAIVPLTGLFYVFGMRLFLRKAGLDLATTRTAMLVLLSFPVMAVHLNFFRMDLLFAGLMLLSTGCLLGGSGAMRRWSGAVLLGGVLAALAGLVKGPLGILFPFATIIVLAFVRRTPRTLLRPDLGLALAIAIVPLLAWLGMVSGWLGASAMPGLAQEQVIDRIAGHTDQSYPWWYFLAALPLATLPWIFLAPATLAMPRVAAGDSGTEGAGRTVMLVYLAIVLVVLSSIAHKSVYYLPMLLPPLAALAADGLRRLEARAPRRLVILFLAIGIAAILLPFVIAWAIGTVPEKEIDRLSAVLRPADLLPVGIAIGGSALLYFAAAAAKGLWRPLALAAATLVIVFSVKLHWLPRAEGFLSARSLIAALDQSVPPDAPLLLYRTFPGALLYYYAHPQRYVSNEEDFRALLAADPAPQYVMMPALVFRESPEWRKLFKRIGTHDVLLQETVLLKSRD